MNVQKKRSIGVFIFGLFFIIEGFIGLSSLINNLQQYMRVYGIIYFIVGAVSTVASLVCGIFILKLNPIARRAAIVICFFNIILVGGLYTLLIRSPMMNRASTELTKDYERKRQYILQFKPEYQQKALERLEKNDELARKIAPNVSKAVMLIFL